MPAMDPRRMPMGGGAITKMGGVGIPGSIGVSLLRVAGMMPQVRESE